MNSEEETKNEKSINIFIEFLKRFESGEDVKQEDYLQEFPELERELRKWFAKIDTEDFDISEFLKRYAEDSVSSSQPQDDSQIIGDFKIIREIGKGGMGTVYEADQISLKRRVALKLLPAHLSFSDYAVKKFWREAEAGGRQSHPGIVAIHAVGEHEGVHYIAQELVPDGYTLVDKLKELKKQKDPPAGYFRKVASFIADIANALQHAHDRGVIHRDIKPSNILLTRDGTPKITDFGLARVEDALDLSRTGDFMGTPYYMSPEQAMSRRMGIDKRTDIFSLGVTLYEMLIFSRPFEGKSSQELLKKIILFDPEDPHKVSSRVPRDLSVICLKAMEKLPEKRYQAMLGFEEDLRRYLSGDVILARPAGFYTRITKRLKRNPVKSATLGVAILAVFVLLVMHYQNLRQSKNYYNQITRLSDLKRIADLEVKADELWPAHPDKSDEYQQWMDEANNLINRLALHRNILQLLRQRAEPYNEETRLFDRETHPRSKELDSLINKKKIIDDEIDRLSASAQAAENEEQKEEFLENSKKYESQSSEVGQRIVELEELIDVRRTWKFTAEADQWWHNTLVDLVADIEKIEDDESKTFSCIEDRLEFSRTVKAKTFIECKHAWNEAIESIADPQKCPHYGGLHIDPQLGFVPIGQDPESGLWEFIHIQTGEIPVRDSAGHLVLTEDMGMVFVLVPGGTFYMGALAKKYFNRSELIGIKNCDMSRIDPAERARTDETPVHDVTVDPFFISKYEMTQGQWLRIMRVNPSFFNPIPKPRGRQITLLHPVEKVSWFDCCEAMRRLGMRLPSEAEWEYSCRANTTFPWWTGRSKESLDGATNIKDLTLKEFSENNIEKFEVWLRDGYNAHAPVGEFRANSFGLHDVCGNVGEWCQDTYQDRYHRAPRDGSPWECAGSEFRVCRGGCWKSLSKDCRSAFRFRVLPHNQDQRLGLRPAYSLR